MVPEIKKRKKEYNRNYRIKNKDKIKQQKNKWYKENNEHVKQKSKQYREENKEYILKQKKKWYHKNKDDLRKKSKEWRDKNPDYLKEYFKKYYIDNREKILIQSKKYREKPEVKKRFKMHYKEIKEKNPEIFKERRKRDYKKHKEKRLEYFKKYRQSEKGKIIMNKKQAKRRNLKWIEIWKNPFPKDISVDYHHINNILVIPLPRQIHSNAPNRPLEVHRKIVNNLILKLYGIDINKLLSDK